MNILRELRKFKRKSVLVKLQILILFFVMLIASAYAWWSIPKSKLNSLQGTVETWDVEYNIENNEVLDEEVTISVDDFAPGMDHFEKTISIRNLGSMGTTITYELTSVKLFGEEVLSELQANNEIAFAGSTINLFVNPTTEEKYPFNVCYTCDRTNINGKYISDEQTPGAVSKLTFYASWEYSKGTDMLDTSIGQKAYDYYNDPTNKPEDVLQFTLKITSKRSDM